MHSHNLILVDDNQALREAMSIMLTLNNYEVTEHSHLQDIFDEVRLPDLYLVDYWLQDMVGSSLCAILKRNEKSKNIPVIMMSGDPTIESAVYAVGADAFLLKPFSMDQMLQIIGDLLNPLSTSVGLIKTGVLDSLSPGNSSFVSKIPPFGNTG